MNVSFCLSFWRHKPDTGFLMPDVATGYWDTAVPVTISPRVKNPGHFTVNFTYICTGEIVSLGIPNFPAL